MIILLSSVDWMNGSARRWQQPVPLLEKRTNQVADLFYRDLGPDFSLQFALGVKRV
jgi:hypothetical protein